MFYMPWRVLWLRAAPLFNSHALVLLAAVLAVEVAEDAIVWYRLLPLDPWRVYQWALEATPDKKGNPFYSVPEINGDPRHLAPLRLHGTRRLNGPLCTTLMHIGGCIILVLMSLPLGAGYMFGICSQPIPASLLVRDAFLWSQPWQCS
eukprot:s1668_g5.t1